MTTETHKLNCKGGKHINFNPYHTRKISEHMEGDKKKEGWNAVSSYFYSAVQILTSNLQLNKSLVKEIPLNQIERQNWWLYMICLDSLTTKNPQYLWSQMLSK